jgi:hypothetical protein
MRLALNAEGKTNFETYEDNKQDRMARNLREVIAAVSAKRRAKIARPTGKGSLRLRRSGSWRKPSASWSLIAI